jgi:hypothetical protein
MKNGDNIFYYYDTTINNLVGGWHQQTLILPIDSYRYCVFCMEWSNTAYTQYLNSTDKVFYIDKFMYNIVDMRGNNGKGEVVAKRVPIAPELPLCQGMQAVKHGNGRDWWILRIGFDTIAPTNTWTLYSYLVDSTGINAPISQVIQAPKPSLVRDGASISISEDGSKIATSVGGYLYGTVDNEFMIADYNRCDATISNIIIDTNTSTYYLKYWQDPNPNNWVPNIVINGQVIPDDGILGMAISPNNRFVYFCKENSVWQYDTWEPDKSKRQYVLMYLDTCD